MHTKFVRWPKVMTPKFESLNINLYCSILVKYLVPNVCISCMGVQVFAVQSSLTMSKILNTGLSTSRRLKRRIVEMTFMQ